MSFFLLTMLGCFSSFPARDFTPDLHLEAPAEEYRGTDGLVYNQGDLIPFDLEVTDPDSEPQDLWVTIESNIDGMLYESPPNSDGRVSILDSTLQPGTHQITISVMEEENYISEVFMLVINAVPVVTEVNIMPESPTTVDELYADVVSFYDDDGDEVELSIEWQRSGVAVEGQQGVTLPADQTTKEERWTVQVTPSDYNGEGSPILATVVIQNSPPTIENITIDPFENVVNDQELRCSASVSDADDDVFNVRYDWRLFYQGEWLEIAENTDTFTSSPSIVQPGDRLYCGVVAGDGEEIEVQSGFVEMENRLPEIAGLGISNSQGFLLGETLTCFGYKSDPDQSETEMTYRWVNDGPANGQVIPVPGSGNVIGLSHQLVLYPQKATKGEQVSCVAVITDPHGGVSEQIESVVVENSPPYLSGVTINPPYPTASDDVECIGVGVDPDPGDTVGFLYTWKRNGVALAETDAVLSASTYGPFDVADLLRCEVTPTDSSDEGDMSASTVEIQNSPPEITALTFVQDAAQVFTGTTLIIEPTAFDINGDNIEYQYDWYVDGGLVRSDNQNTLAGTLFFSKGQTVHVTAIPSDGIADGTMYTSSSVTVRNAPPSSPVVSLGGDFIHDDYNLICQVLTPSVDPDGDPITYEFILQGDGHPPPYGQYTSNYLHDSVNAVATDVASNWTCAVRGDDGTDFGSRGLTATTITACDYNEIYDIEMGFYDLENIENCWGAGAMPISSFGTELPFNTFDGDWGGTGLIAYAYNALNSTKPKILRNPGTTAVSHEEGTFTSGVLALYPGESLSRAFIRWMAPLDATCDINLDFQGISEGFTSTSVYLYYESQEVESTSVVGYLAPVNISTQVTLLAGEVIYLIHDYDPLPGDSLPIFPNSGHDWISLEGTIACVY